MPLQWFCSVRWAGGLEDTGEVWQGKVGAERNDGKGMGEMSESTRTLIISHVNSKFCLELASFYIVFFTKFMWFC